MNFQKIIYLALFISLLNPSANGQRESSNNNSYYTLPLNSKFGSSLNSAIESSIERSAPRNFRLWHEVGVIHIENPYWVWHEDPNNLWNINESEEIVKVVLRGMYKTEEDVDPFTVNITSKNHYEIAIAFIAAEYIGNTYWGESNEVHEFIEDRIIDLLNEYLLVKMWEREVNSLNKLKVKVEYIKNFLENHETIEIPKIKEIEKKELDNWKWFETAVGIWNTSIPIIDKDMVSNYAKNPIANHQDLGEFIKNIDLQIQKLEEAISSLSKKIASEAKEPYGKLSNSFLSYFSDFDREVNIYNNGLSFIDSVKNVFIEDSILLDTVREQYFITTDLIEKNQEETLSTNARIDTQEKLLKSILEIQEKNLSRLNDLTVLLSKEYENCNSESTSFAELVESNIECFDNPKIKRIEKEVTHVQTTLELNFQTVNQYSDELNIEYLALNKLLSDYDSLENMKFLLKNDYDEKIVEFPVKHEELRSRVLETERIINQFHLKYHISHVKTNVYYYHLLNYTNNYLGLNQKSAFDSNHVQLLSIVSKARGALDRWIDLYNDKIRDEMLRLFKEVERVRNQPRLLNPEPIFGPGTVYSPVSFSTKIEPTVLPDINYRSLEIRN